MREIVSAERVIQVVKFVFICFVKGSNGSLSQTELLRRRSSATGPTLDQMMEEEEDAHTVSSLLHGAGLGMDICDG